MHPQHAHQLVRSRALYISLWVGVCVFTRAQTSLAHNLLASVRVRVRVSVCVFEHAKFESARVGKGLQKVRNTNSSARTYALFSVLHRGRVACCVVSVSRVVRGAKSSRSLN